MPTRKPTLRQRVRVSIGWAAQLMLLGNIWRRRNALKGYLIRDFKVRYAGTSMGIAWSLLRPLLILAVYYFAFGVVLDIRTGNETGPGYAVYLLTGLIPWFAFIEAATVGSKSLTTGMGLVRKVRLPFELLTFKAVLQPALVYLPFLLILWLALSEFRTAYQLFPLIFWYLLQVLFTYYLVHVIAILTAVIRDIGEIFNVVISRMIFVSPILFSMSRVPEEFVAVMYLNPITPFVNGYHNLILEGRLPAQVDILAVAIWLTLFAGAAILLHQRVADDLVDWA